MVTYLTKVLDLNGWNKKQEIFCLPEFRKVTDYLYSSEIMSKSDNKNFIPSISQPTKDKIVERLQNFEVFPFIRAYINKFGSSFSDSNFNYTFKVWFDSLQASNLSRRILVLKIFFLKI